MTKDQVLKNVTKLLKKNKLPIVKKSIVHKEEHLIFTEPVVVLLDKNQKINLAFHAATSPEFSARLTLEFKELDGIKDVNIGEVFIFNRENQMITGNDAIEEYDKQNYNGAIKSFMREQLSEHMLHNGEAKNC